MALQFWLVLAALAGLVAVEVIFWTLTQPLNKYWLQNTELSRSATRFFEVGSAAEATNWTAMRKPLGVLACPSRNRLRAGTIAADHGRCVVSKYICCSERLPTPTLDRTSSQRGVS
jgi:hypothetical protein